MSVLIRTPRNAAGKALSLLRTIQYAHPPSCPCHSNPSHHHHNARTPPFQAALSALRAHSSSPPSKEYAFEMAASSIRFGDGATQEVGMDLKNLKATNVCVVTDATVDALFPMRQVRESLDREGIKYTVFNRVTIEPKDYSVSDAIDWARGFNADCYVAVGGGSVIDTAKLMNLYSVYSDAPLADFIAAPTGAGRPIDRPLRPLIAIPTTAGTGSETTGTAIFDLTAQRAKTGVAHRNLKPLLGICDPLNTRSMPAAVKASSGLDVLCHSLESWTAIPYTERSPRPANPLLRPAYQGANPISDVFSLHALRQTVKYLPRAVKDPEDREAQREMLLAATLAGVGFGNAGVHLCHGMSYPIASQNPGQYQHAGYQVSSPIIPHGVSVAVTAPAVFRFTGPSNPERHLQAAEAFGVDTSTAHKASAGEILGDAIRGFLDKLGDQPTGLGALGFSSGDIDGLVEGTLPQGRVLKLAPGLKLEGDEQTEQLRRLFEDSM
ncbi:hypothetical protein BROUX41_000651 [Berkeleyomyces rouxiae]|uniref:uncharacterized protein n=1 Tax=Berkeleyomyces rouxiae TaxID=2035830 RepID=UPI003B80BCD1